VSRTHRFLGGLSLGYLYLGLVTIVGLWLTPFLLGRIGTHDYGLWLVTTQILGYLQLLDLGVVALAPREVAYATGRALQGAEGASVAETVARFRRVVAWQVPATAIVAAVCWWAVASRWPELGAPLAVIVIAFVAAFPLRLFHATLQGLQDLAFLGRVQLWSWLCGTTVTVVLVLRGVGLGALAAGWVVTQAVSAVSCGIRLRRHFASAWKARRADVPWRDARQLMGRSVWISLSQLGQVLLAGSDLLIIGAVFGPAAAVPYACTGKLVTVLANHPQLLMQTAAPALAEMRTGASRTRVTDVALALMRAMLVVSGGVAAFVLAVNAIFVSWWVGPVQYGGFLLTVLFVITMLVRHLGTTLTYALFAYGHERRLSLTAIGDGVVTAIATAVLAYTTDLGIASAPLGSLAGVMLVNIPATARALSRELSISPGALFASLSGWAVRFVAVAAAAVIASRALDPHGLIGLVWMSALVGVAYLVVMLPLVLKPPLGPYLRAAVAPLLALVTRPAATASSGRP